jgi:hypothetical protein
VAAWQIPSGRGTVGLSGMEPYLAQAQLMAERAFRLPPGCRVRVGADELILRRFDGSIVGAFGGPTAVPEVAERAANEDLRRSLEIAG